MAASISIGGHSSDAGLNLLSAVDLLLHERSLHSFFSTKTGIKSIDHKFQDLFSGAKVIGIGQRSEDEAYVCLLKQNSKRRETDILAETHTASDCLIFVGDRYETQQHTPSLHSRSAKYDHHVKHPHTTLRQIEESASCG